VDDIISSRFIPTDSRHLIHHPPRRGPLVQCLHLLQRIIEKNVINWGLGRVKCCNGGSCVLLLSYQRRWLPLHIWGMLTWSCTVPSQMFMRRDEPVTGTLTPHCVYLTGTSPCTNQHTSKLS
jgi:hypothetical protein